MIMGERKSTPGNGGSGPGGRFSVPVRCGLLAWLWGDEISYFRKAGEQERTEERSTLQVAVHAHRFGSAASLS